MVWSSPEGGTNALKLLYLLALAAARRTVDIQSPYLITDESTIWSLLEARKRGVRVRLLTEGDITDAKPVKFAARAQYERLLEHGVEVYEYKPTMMHVKAMMVDGVLSIIGSANFDNRSLELNDEPQIVALDPGIGQQMEQIFLEDLKYSKEIKLEEFEKRPWTGKALEWGASQLRRIL